MIRLACLLGAIAPVVVFVAYVWSHVATVILPLSR